MDKEAKCIIRYYKILTLKVEIEDWIKQLFILNGIILFVHFLFVGNIKRHILSYCLIMLIPVFMGLIVSSVLKIYEFFNKNIIYGPGLEKNLTIDEIIEVLHIDKKIHSVIMKKVASNRSLTRYEKIRYDGVRRFHYSLWFMQSEEESDVFRRKESTEIEVEQYLEKQAKMKDELLYVFDDDEDVQEMILEQYNRVRTKTLVWPKVISKE